MTSTARLALLATLVATVVAALGAARPAQDVTQAQVSQWWHLAWRGGRWRLVLVDHELTR